ncbi:MAG: hypothetical protein A2V65_06405 [Deltaproteobacteria bacterium RBG_13_49_15]|nr:MAG: hypothetical protein A2V65_06405 [Deltaproteobacteria bacterium RBG_13_49_15]
MRFVGQGSETDLAVERKVFSKFRKEEIRKMFDKTYQKLYGRTYPETPVEFVTFKVRASLPERPFSISPLSGKSDGLSACIKGKRPAYSVLLRKYIPFTVYDRMKLFPEAKIKGPAIIEEKESTIIIGEDAAASVDGFGFVWIDLKNRGRHAAKTSKKKGSV